MIPIRNWARSVPPGAQEQLELIASQPYVVEHIAAMPDLHVADGIAVGTVFATLDTIVPSALGGDLGCGMSAIRFGSAAANHKWKGFSGLLQLITQTIPAGDLTQRGRRAPLPDFLLEKALSTGSLNHTRERLGPKHLGTLGGGNHFIELDRDAGGDLWLLVHSGSRGLGSAIAAHHCRVAEVKGLGGIPGLRCETTEGRACSEDIEWALSFARANRRTLLDRVIHLMSEWLGQLPDPASCIDVHHNFVSAEDHFGRQLLVHRKGAIAAPLGELALIPGSMATASYIVEGLGSAASFRSASHGAGRVMTRREARAHIRVERFERTMKGIEFDLCKRASLVEESSHAYRNIKEVLEDEADLVKPILRLEPVLVFKG